MVVDDYIRYEAKHLLDDFNFSDTSLPHAFIRVE